MFLLHRRLGIGFQGVFTDKASAPVDKRGKRKRRGSGNDSLKEFYRIEDEKKQKKLKKEKEESEDESEREEELIDLKSKLKGKKPVESSEGESEEESEKLGVQLASLDEESDEEDEVSEEEEDTDQDDEADYEEDGFEILDENIASIDKETHRLAIVNMDWRFVSAKDLYVVLNSFLPKEGRILSVALYPTEFGLERMKEEEVHGPAIGGDKKNEDDDDEDDEEDEEEINRKARDYEKSLSK